MTNDPKHLRGSLTLSGLVVALLAAGCSGGNSKEIAQMRSENDELRKEIQELRAAVVQQAAVQDAASSGAVSPVTPAPVGDASPGVQPAGVQRPERWSPEQSRSARGLAAEVAAPAEVRSAAPREAASSSSAPTPEAAPPVNLLERAAPVERPAPPVEDGYVAETRRAAPGALLTMLLSTGLDSATSKVGDVVEGTLADDLRADNDLVVLPYTTKILGRVTDVQAAHRLERKSGIAVHFDVAEMPDGTRVPISAGRKLEGKGYTKKDGAVVGGSAAGGALLGQLLGGDSESTVMGGIVGGAIGSGVLFGKKGQDISVPAGTQWDVALNEAVTVTR